MKKLNQTTWVGIAITALVLVLAVAGLLLLPDTVIAQIGFGGQPQNYMPKPLFMALPIGISLLGLGISTQDSKRFCAILMPVIALGVLIFAFVVNR